VLPSRRILAVVAAIAVVAAAIVAGAVLAGGSDGSDGDTSDGVSDAGRTVQPGAPGEESRELSDDEAAAVEAPEHTPADTAFVQDMIVHHSQALEMAALVDDRTERTDLPLLAERITVSQEAEIEQLEQWLTDRDENVPDDSAREDHAAHTGMPGMASPQDLDRLAQARGDAFDRLFLELMIAHHAGAITMVDELYAAGGGLEPAADGRAREIRVDQEIEIGRMQDLQRSLR
jgi:uncharacterized protein (DUF305 family)